MALTPITPPLKRSEVDIKSDASKEAFTASMEAFNESMATTVAPEINATEANMVALEASAQTAKTAAETARTGAETAQGLAEAAATYAENTVATLPAGSISDTVVSDEQAYSSAKVESRLAEERAEIEALIVPSFQLGDLMESAKGLSTPAWLQCNQNQYNTTTYSDLYALLGDLPSPTATAFTTTTQSSTGGFGLGNNGNHFAYGMTSSPYIGAYHWNGSTFQAITMTAGARAPEFVSIGGSGDDSYVLATGGSGICGFYKLNATTQTKLSDPTGNIGNAVTTAWNDTATVVVGTYTSAPYSFAYTRSGDTLTQLTVPAGATEATYQCAINSDGTVFYTIGTTKVFKYTITGSTVSYVGSWSHGLSFVPTNAPRLKAELTGDGKYLFIGQRSVTTANGIILGEFDTENETMIYINANAATHPLDGTAGTNYATYNMFSRLGQTKMIANLITTTASYNVVATIFDTANGLNEVETLSFHNGLSATAYNTVHACDTYCIGANSGTTVWKTNLGKYLPNIPKKYINTGVQ